MIKSASAECAFDCVNRCTAYQIGYHINAVKSRGIFGGISKIGFVWFQSDIIIFGEAFFIPEEVFKINSPVSANTVKPTAENVGLTCEMSAVTVVFIHNYYVFGVAFKKVIKFSVFENVVDIIGFLPIDVFHVLPDKKSAVFGAGFDA